MLEQSDHVVSYHIFRTFGVNEISLERRGLIRRTSAVERSYTLTKKGKRAAVRMKSAEQELLLACELATNTMAERIEELRDEVSNMLSASGILERVCLSAGVESQKLQERLKNISAEMLRNKKSTPKDILFTRLRFIVLNNAYLDKKTQ